MSVSPNKYEQEHGPHTCFDCGSKRWVLFPRSAELPKPEVCQSCLGLADPDGPINWEPNVLYPDIIGFRLRRSWDGKGTTRPMELPSLWEYASREWKYPDVLEEHDFGDGSFVRTCALEHPTKYGCFFVTYYVSLAKNVIRELGWYRVKEEARRSHPFHVRYAEGRRAATRK